jgi:RNA polymerase sigma-70 factor (ECF subfamily)
MHVSETSLVQRAQRGDAAAFEELIRRTSRLVFARLHIETGDVHRSEDLLQETLVTAFRSIGQLGEPEKFRPWLLKIASNLAVNAAKHDLRLKRFPRPLPPSNGTPPPESSLEKDEQREQLLQALRTLPEEYRLPLWLRYFGGADYDTIQTQMGLTNGALRGLLHRGLKMLREELERTGMRW